MLSLINQLLKALPIEKSKQHRLKVLISYIDTNRHRVKSVYTRLNHVHEEEDKRHLLQQLVREDLPENQFLRIRELEKDLLDLPTIVEVLKERKIDQGINPPLPHTHTRTPPSPTHTATRPHGHAAIRPRGHPATRSGCHAATPTRGHVDMRTRRYAGTRIHGHAEAETNRRTDAQTYRGRDAQKRRRTQAHTKHTVHTHARRCVYGCVFAYAYVYGAKRKSTYTIR